MGSLATGSPGTSCATSGSASSGPSPGTATTYPATDWAPCNLLAPDLPGKDGGQDFGSVLDPNSESQVAPSGVSGANPKQNSETCL